MKVCIDGTVFIPVDGDISIVKINIYKIGLFECSLPLSIDPLQRVSNNMICLAV